MIQPLLHFRCCRLVLAEMLGTVACQLNQLLGAVVGLGTMLLYASVMWCSKRTTSSNPRARRRSKRSGSSHCDRIAS